MSRYKNLAPIIIVLAIVIATGVSTHKPSHQAATHTGITNSPAIPQGPSNQYPGATAPELASAPCHANGALPDVTCTPGIPNPNVTQNNIQQTICVRGFTKTIRPPASYSNNLKAKQMTEYGYTDSIHAHEEDHLISLELGGSPDDPKNLWPEPHASPNPKDEVENFLHAAVCSGRIALHDAQVRIATNWITAEAGL